MSALRLRAQSYFRDAQRFADMPADDLAADGMTYQWWAVVFHAVASELHKVADEMEVSA